MQKIDASKTAKLAAGELPAMPAPSAADRIAIEDVWPRVDDGQFAVKRVVGDRLDVWADVFCDGHAALAAALCWRRADQRRWQESAMVPTGNDRWHGSVQLQDNTRYAYRVCAWRDEFASWRHDVLIKREAGQDIALELQEGSALVQRAASRVPALGGYARQLTAAAQDADQLAALLLDDELTEQMRRHAPRADLSASRSLEVIVDRPRAVFGAWYELFPRSASNDARRHGRFDDVIARLPYMRELGFDVLYLPPIHPIGRTHRKGRNNSLQAAADDPGSPWAIGGAAGGHTAIHPELGTLADFRRLVAAANELDMEIALDFAIQCSRDHPWIKEHPEWFDWRPDGSIRFAENPPKKYEDIVNVHFYGDAYPSLWQALHAVVEFWIEQGVRIFRVDNPHTKPLPFWQWLIATVQQRHPDVIFLAEAFTRPKMMQRLAKVGFTQSYTYFTWRNTKDELTQYMRELTVEPAKEYFRPNFFVNTPDINPYYLQQGGRPAFRVRAALAATLSSLWGMYSGYELCEADALPGREEYLDSEKYQLKARDFDAPHSIRSDIASLNRIRRQNPALQRMTGLQFHPAHDPNILFYARSSADGANVLWIAVNLDPHAAHEADIELPLYTLGLEDNASVAVHDLMEGHRFQWQGKWQRLRLDPFVKPFAIWRISPAREEPA